MANTTSYQAPSSGGYKGAGLYGNQGPSSYRPGKNGSQNPYGKLLNQYFRENQQQILQYLQQHDPYSGNKHPYGTPQNGMLPGILPGMQPGNGGVTVIVINPIYQGTTGFGDSAGFQDDLRRKMFENVQGIMSTYGVSQGQAGRYLMDAHTLQQQGYSQPGAVLKDFYQSMQNQDSGKKDFYQGLEKLADKMSRESLERAA